jgi:hypothetical protein
VTQVGFNTLAGGDAAVGLARMISRSSHFSSSILISWIPVKHKS